MWVQLPPLPLKLFSVRSLDNTPNRRYNRTMTIDTNTVILALISAAAGYFGVGYFRMKLNSRFSAMQKHMDDNLSEIFATHDRLYREIHLVDKKVDCCKNKQEKCDKTYYNSQA